jgi:hypothetical protein
LTPTKVNFRFNLSNSSPLSSSGLTGRSPEAPERSREAAAYWIARRSLSSGAHSRDPLAGDDDRMHQGMRSHSRGAIASRLCVASRPQKRRGRREDRVHAAPAVSCAIAHKERAHEHTGSAETLRPSLRNGFTAYFVLSPVNGFLATVAHERRALTNLMPAPRHQDHTTSPYA